MTDAGDVSCNTGSPPEKTWVALLKEIVVPAEEKVCAWARKRMVPNRSSPLGDASPKRRPAPKAIWPA